MSKTYILQSFITVEMLISFFKINVILRTICNGLVHHIFLDFIIYTTNGIY
ncbi:hypothetical protein D3C78_1133190 [compost metagenome]